MLCSYASGRVGIEDVDEIALCLAMRSPGEAGAGKQECGKNTSDTMAQHHDETQGGRKRNGYSNDAPAGGTALL